MIEIKSERYLIPLLLVAVSAASLVLAYIAQYWFGLQPCVLCLYQRVPYALVLVLSVMSFGLHEDAYVVKPLLKLSGVIFLAGASIAIFHVGVEQGWWAGTEDCGGFGAVESVEDLKSKIMAAPVKRCDDPSFFFLGITMAAWNAIYSSILALICFYKGVKE